MYKYILGDKFNRLKNFLKIKYKILQNLRNYKKYIISKIRKFIICRMFKCLKDAFRSSFRKSIINNNLVYTQVILKQK